MKQRGVKELPLNLIIPQTISMREEDGHLQQTAHVAQLAAARFHANMPSKPALDKPSLSHSLQTFPFPCSPFFERSAIFVSTFLYIHW